ncbi:hypothetical protein KEM48_014241 [Puccinia striiformis f. sp. tritici PST-130]|nr:hypothetical protein KEM48_014241 [Puccinia striiformis f. sp. tritici PST-130]
MSFIHCSGRQPSLSHSLRLASISYQECPVKVSIFLRGTIHHGVTIPRLNSGGSGIGLTPDPDHISPRGKSWKPLSHLKKFPIKLNVGLTTFNKFHHIIADACNAKVKNAGVLITNALASGAPKLAWHVWHVPAIAEEFMKKTIIKSKTSVLPPLDGHHSQAEIDVQDHVLTTEAAKDAAAKRKATGDDSSVEVVTASDFSPLNVHMRKLFELHEPNKNYHPTIPVFRDSTDPDQYLLLTTAVCQEWAHALRGKVDGVGWFNPPAKFKMLKLSSKKRKTGDSSNTVGPPIVPDFN